MRRRPVRLPARTAAGAIPPIPGRWTRRGWLAAAAGIPAVLAGCSSRFLPVERGPFGVLLTGGAGAGGFNAMVLEALTRAEGARGIPMQVRVVEADGFEPVADALRELARSRATMVIGVGARTAGPLQRVAWEFPERRFTLLDGDLMRPNLATYRLREEETAWLSGFLAARLSRSRSIGVLRGAPRAAQDRIEAAFRAGAARGVPECAVLAAAGAGDPPDAVPQLASERVDVVYAALDEAPLHAAAAARACGMRLVGRLRDWSDLAPGTVVASCLVDPGALFEAMTQDIVDAVWRGDLVRSFGLRHPRMLSFAVDPSIPAPLAAELRSLAFDLAGGRIVPVPDPAAAAHG